MHCSVKMERVFNLTSEDHGAYFNNPYYNTGPSTTARTLCTRLNLSLKEGRGINSAYRIKCSNATLVAKLLHNYYW